MVVANAEGLATGVPFLTVVVAFSVVRTDPVELIVAAREKPTVSNKWAQRVSFMMVKEAN